MQAIKVLPKGQITLPKNVRERLGIDVGDPLILEEKNNEIILKKTKTIFDYAGILPDLGISIDKMIEKATIEAANDYK
ncbi:MAG: AbrB/MazE/SpoVT family DNA-binding domain-containing protein [bacterium]